MYRHRQLLADHNTGFLCGWLFVSSPLTGGGGSTDGYRHQVGVLAAVLRALVEEHAQEVGVEKTPVQPGGLTALMHAQCARSEEQTACRASH